MDLRSVLGGRHGLGIGDRHDPESAGFSIAARIGPQPRRNISGTCPGLVVADVFTCRIDKVSWG